jgi:hypothetical protein
MVAHDVERKANMAETDVVAGDRSLAELETVIERGLASFVEVGTALLEIRDRQLHRERGYERFEDYCRERFDISLSRAYQLMDGATVVKVLAAPTSTDVESVPVTEAQTRELAPLARSDPEAARRVWVEASRERPNPPAPLLRKRVYAEYQAKQAAARDAQPYVHRIGGGGLAGIAAVAGSTLDDMHNGPIREADPATIRRLREMSAERRAYLIAQTTTRRTLLEFRPDGVVASLAQADRAEVRRFLRRLQQWASAWEAALATQGTRAGEGEPVNERKRSPSESLKES